MLIVGVGDEVVLMVGVGDEVMLLDGVLLGLGSGGSL